MDDKEHKGNCLAIASGLQKIDDNGNRINLSPEEIVEAATKFFSFINLTAEQKEPKNG